MRGGGARLLAVVAVIAAAVIIVPPAFDDDRREDRPSLTPPVRNDMTPTERAEVFSLRALAAADALDPMGLYYSFSEDVENLGSQRWRIGFGRSRCGVFENKEGRYQTCKPASGKDRLGNAKTDSWLVVGLGEVSWRVIDVQGNFDGGIKEPLATFVRPDRQETPHWEFPSVHVGPSPWGKGTTLGAAGLWVGPIPYHGPGSHCTPRAWNRDGELVYEGEAQYQQAPDEHWERAGGFSAFEFNAPATRGRVSCNRLEEIGWQPVTIDLEVIGDEAVRVISPLEFVGEPVLNAEAECFAAVLDQDGEVLGTGFQQIRGVFPPPDGKRNGTGHYDLSFRIETDRPEEAVRADVECRMA